MEGKEDKKRVVVVAMDWSKHSEYAFKWYAENLHRKTDEVVITNCPERVDYPHDKHKVKRKSNLGGTLSMYDYFPIRTASEIIEASESTIDKLYKMDEEKTKAVAERINDLAKKYKIEHTFVHLYGHPGQTIVQTAEAKNADLIVCGSRGRGIFRRTILGSISNYVIHHARMPVAICKHEDEQKRLKLWPFS